MELKELVEQVVSAAVLTVSAPSEADYHAVWLQHRVGRESPLLIAALGGALADRLAWVFVAGYQATLRRTFPDLPVEDGWCAFVNTEDPSGTLPPTSLTGEPGHRRLSGTKTWLAMADHVDRLLVSARHNTPPFIVVRRDQAGVRIESGGPKSYLSEMVQGRVTFDDIPVPEKQITGDERTFPVFRASESAYVRVALNAFILNHTRRLGGPPALIGGAVAELYASAALLDLDLPSPVAALGLHGVDMHTQALASEFEGYVRAHDEALFQLWTKDRRLVTGASAGIAARAAAVLGQGVERHVTGAERGERV